MSSGKKETLSIGLPAETIDWLDASVKSHSLPSRSKAIRCCVTCVALGDVKMVEDGNAATSVQITDHRVVSIELASQQIDWVDSVASKKEGSSQSEIIRSVLNACMDADEEVVFGVVRCKRKVTACEGAQDAVDLLGERYGKDVKVKEEIKLL